MIYQSDNDIFLSSVCGMIADMTFKSVKRLKDHRWNVTFSPSWIRYQDKGRNDNFRLPMKSKRKCWQKKNVGGKCLNSPVKCELAIRNRIQVTFKLSVNSSRKETGKFWSRVHSLHMIKDERQDGIQVWHPNNGCNFLKFKTIFIVVDHLYNSHRIYEMITRNSIF